MESFVVKALQSILLSCKSGMVIHDLVKEFREMEGTNIPFKELGYDTFSDFLRTSDFFVIKSTDDGLMVLAKQTANSKHVNDLVKSQNHSKKTGKPSKNKRSELQHRNFNTMNMMPQKMNVQIRLEIPKLNETDVNRSRNDGWNFEIDPWIDPAFPSPSTMPQMYNYPMTLMNGSDHNGIPCATKYSEAPKAIAYYHPNNVQIAMPNVSEYDELIENKAVTEIPSLNLPWYDNEWPITVTTVVSTDDVWGYLRGHDYYPKLESTLKKYEKEILSGEKVPSIAKNIKPGEYYYIMLPKCYRLRVLDNNKNDRKALCLLIDYAEDEWFNWDQMYEMDHNLSHIPGQAVRFSLINLEEYAGHKAFTNKAITCLIGKQLIAKVKTTEKDYAMQNLINRMDPKVKILLFNQITGQNVNEMILEKNNVADEPIEQCVMIVQCASHSQPDRIDINVPIPMETEPIVKQMKIPIRNLPAMKQSTVIITSALSPSDFHFRLLSDDGIMSSLMKSLSNASSSFNHHHHDSNEIKAGNYYAAKFTDGRWYRLQVKDLIGNTVNAYRCDVGDTQSLQTAKLYQLTSEFVQWPQLAIPAKLDDIIPVDEIWSDKANAYFRKLTLNVRLQAQFTESHAADQTGVTYPIKVILIEAQLRCQIGDIMTEQRLAKKA